jgi:hypothetical protein
MRDVLALPRELFDLLLEKTNAYVFGTYSVEFFFSR